MTETMIPETISGTSRSVRKTLTRSPTGRHEGQAEAEHELDGDGRRR